MNLSISPFLFLNVWLLFHFSLQHSTNLAFVFKNNCKLLGRHLSRKDLKVIFSNEILHALPRQIFPLNQMKKQFIFPQVSMFPETKLVERNIETLRRKKRQKLYPIPSKPDSECIMISENIVQRKAIYSLHK